MNTQFKLAVYDACLESIKSKIDIIADALVDAMEAGNDESKSSAGDKHEVGKAMMQLEQEKLSSQLDELEKQEDELKRINLNLQNDYVAKGSLVYTNQGYLFVGIGLGRIKIGDQVVSVVSTSSPLGKKLIGLKQRESLDVNGTNYEIRKIF